MSIFWDNALPIMYKKGLTQIDMSKAINRPRNTVHNWIKYDRVPPVDYAFLIADFLNVSIYSLVDIKSNIADPETERAIQILKKDSELKQLVINYSILSPEERESLWELMRPAVKMIMDSSKNIKRREESAS